MFLQLSFDLFSLPLFPIFVFNCFRRDFICVPYNRSDNIFIYPRFCFDSHVFVSLYHIFHTRYRSCGHCRLASYFILKISVARYLHAKIFNFHFHFISIHNLLNNVVHYTEFASNWYFWRSHEFFLPLTLSFKYFDVLYNWNKNVCRSFSFSAIMVMIIGIVQNLIGIAQSVSLSPIFYSCFRTCVIIVILFSVIRLFFSVVSF